MDKLDQEIQEHEEQRIRYELDKRNFAERTLQRSRLSMSIMKRAYAQKMAPKQLNIWAISSDTRTAIQVAEELEQNHIQLRTLVYTQLLGILHQFISVGT